MKLLHFGVLCALAVSAPALAWAATINYTYSPNDARLQASNCFQCHGVNGAYSKAFEGLAGSSEVYQELLEMSQATSVEREKELMAVHAKALSKIGGVNGANGPRIEMQMISDFFKTQTSGAGAGGGSGDDDVPVIPKSYTLSLSKKNYKYGTVTSSPAGLSCGTTCSSANGTFSTGTAVKLTAKAVSRRRFVGWSGACTGTATTCTVTMNAEKSVTASFR